MAIRESGFAVFRVATVSARVLVFVCGLDMQVSPNQVIPQVDTFFWEITSSTDQVTVNLMRGWWRLRLWIKAHKAGSPYIHMAKMSSTHLHHAHGILSWVHRNSHSSFPMNKLTYDGAIQVPLAVRCIYKLSAHGNAMDHKL